MKRIGGGEGWLRLSNAIAHAMFQHDLGYVLENVGSRSVENIPDQRTQPILIVN